MADHPSLIATLVAGIVFAFAFGFLASRLHLPPLVGYLVAGIAVGPFTPGFVGDVGLAGQLAEIGVILLMFGVGLHFSVDDLLAVYRIAIPGALAQMAVAVLLGAGLAVAWRWDLAAGLLLGLALSVASTVVLLRVLEDTNTLDSGDGRIAVGWLIVQDLAMVLALVLLPAFAHTSGDGGERLAWTSYGMAAAVTLGKVALFVALILIVGKRVVPWILIQAARTRSRELFTLSVLAAALGIAYGSAALFGVSFALGAFFAGVVLSETELSHQAAANSLPLRDAFAVLFFVSVGMLFDPRILLEEPFRILAILVIILIAKSIAAVAVLLAFGQSLATALRVSVGLAQIGEFSFILAGLGIALGLLPAEARDLILAGALLSMTLNPLAFEGAGRLVRWFEARPALLTRFERSASAYVKHVSDSEPGRLHGHVVIVGYGRVGSMIGQVLGDLELPFVAIERDHRLAAELRQRGLKVIWGNAVAPGVLNAACIAKARLLVLAVPDPFQARLVLEHARAANPQIDSVVRTHSDSEATHLKRQGAGLAVMAERELVFAMLDYVLRGLEFREAEAHLLVQAVRLTGTIAGVTQPDTGAAQRPAPELRPHAAEDARVDQDAAGEA